MSSPYNIVLERLVKSFKQRMDINIKKVIFFFGHYLQMTSIGEIDRKTTGKSKTGQLYICLPQSYSKIDDFPLNK